MKDLEKGEFEKNLKACISAIVDKHFDPIERSLDRLVQETERLKKGLGMLNWDDSPFKKIRDRLNEIEIKINTLNEF